MKPSSLAWVPLLALGAACATLQPSQKGSLERRAPKPADCRVDSLPSAPSDGSYETLGSIPVDAGMNARGELPEKLRQLGCRVGADALLIEMESVLSFSSKDPSRALQRLKVTYSAKPGAPKVWVAAENPEPKPKLEVTRADLEKPAEEPMPTTDEG